MEKENAKVTKDAKDKVDNLADEIKNLKQQTKKKKKLKNLMGVVSPPIIDSFPKRKDGKIIDNDF